MDFLKKTLTRFLADMLVPTVLLPSVLTATPDDRDSFYGLTIELFRKLEKKGVFLVEDRDRINNEIVEIVNKWPSKYKNKIQKLLKQINKKNRFVEVDIDERINITCLEPKCQSCIGITKQHLPQFVLARLNCYSCVKKQMAEIVTVKVVNSDDYAIDDNFCDVMEKLSSIAFLLRE